MLCNNLEFALTGAIAVEGFIEHQRIDYRHRLSNRLQAECDSLVKENCEVVWCVVSDHRNTAIKAITQSIENLTDNLLVISTLCHGHFCGDSVNIAGHLRNFDLGIGKPFGAVYNHGSVKIKLDHTRGHDSGGLQV